MNILETTRARNFKIYQHIALENLYISTGNDVISYLRSAANRCRSRFPRNKIIVVAVVFQSHIREDIWTCINVSETSDIASMIDDSRSEMNDVTFRTAPLIGGLSCLS